MDKMIHTYRLRYLVPFTFQNYQNLYDNLKMNNNWAVMSGKSEQEQDVYPFILNSFSPDESKNHLGSAWLFCRSEKNKKLPTLSYHKQGESPLKLKITEAGLFLFQSRVGFFWYEIQMGKTFTPDKLIEIQNQIKELNRRSNMERFFLISEENLRFNVEKNFISTQKPDHAGWIFCKNPHPCYIELSALKPAGISKNIMPDIAKTADSLEAVRFYPDRETGNYGFLCNRLQKFTLGNWIAQNLLELSPGITFFAEKKNCIHTISLSANTASYPSQVPDKALLFTYAVFDSSQENTLSDMRFLESAYDLTNGYKNSYKMNPEIAADMYRPFQNTLWYATREGCGYFVKTDKAGEDFFRHNMRSKIINDYFILYVLLLYQSYSLLRFSISIMENLPAEPGAYMANTGHSIEMLRELNCEINTFLVKGVHTSVSFVNHQNLFFRYVMQALNIEADIKSVTIGLTALLELQNGIEKQQEMLAEKQEEEQRRKADDAMNDSLGLISMLAVISAFTDGLGLISEINSILSNDTISIGNIISLFIFMLLAVLILRIAYPAIKLYWHRHKKAKKKRHTKR